MRTCHLNRTRNGGTVNVPVGLPACLAAFLNILLSGCPAASGTATAVSPVGESGVISREGVLPEGAVLPSGETIKSGEYTPLSRPLFLYVSKAALEKPATTVFMRYYLSEEALPLVSEVGYIPLTREVRQEQQRRLEEAIAEAGTSVDGPLSGSVIVDGSSTVYPVTQAVAEEFSKLHRRVRVPVGVSGTGGGFKKFCHREIDIAAASRPIAASEVELCRANGIEYIELECCIDGLTVVVHPENDWVRGMTIQQLREIWKPESTIQRWSDIDPEFPDQPLKLLGPDTDSGTFEYFTEAICGRSRASRSDYQQSSDDNFLVTGVSGDRYALAYFGYAYYAENRHRLKALAIAP